jgi:endonuclease/exonuclease/phosphatase (EEP) superfamily protein YafD
VTSLLRGFLILLGVWVVSGTVLNLSRHPHWYVRGWDFPRLVIAGLGLLAGVPYVAFFWTGAWYDSAFVGALALSVAWQVYNIVPYTPLGRRPVKRARRPSPDRTFRLVISNVLIENTQYDRWLSVVTAPDPDLILAVEVDAKWEHALRGLERSHPHVLRQPLDNAYGMALFSRLPLHGGRVEYLIEPGIPSIHVEVELLEGTRFALHGVHPRPPEPKNDQDSRSRDAELMKLGKRIAARRAMPTVVAGDLNDVAWSYTTHLFLRESRLLDPRLGRGLFNTFNANSRLFRFPLDHVFHSSHFKLVALRRLPHVGSDHFPVLIELSYEPEARAEQPEPHPSASDEREAERMIAEGSGRSSGAPAGE